jgi:hypothetical protein
MGISYATVSYIGHATRWVSQDIPSVYKPESVFDSLSRTELLDTLTFLHRSCTMQELRELIYFIIGFVLEYLVAGFVSW